MAVDAYGGTAYDPSENVLRLTDAAVQRIDDMADLRARLADEQFKRLESMAALRAEYGKEIRQLQNEHNASLRHAESARLDSIRQVDREDVSKTAAQVLNAVQTLASTAGTTAETLRTQVSTTAAAAEQRSSASAGDFNKRLTELERALSEGKGKQQVADPQMDKLTELVAVLARNQAAGGGKSEGTSDTVKMIAVVITMFVGLILIGTFVFVTSRQPQQPVYYPAPVGSTLPTSPSTQVPR
jgi:ABC-type transporter Mla subunit MlaD